jgi:hypothetical protein
MAKNIVKAESGGLSLPENLRSGATVEGLDEARSLIGRMAMYNGTTEEQTMYDGCDFKPGDFIDVLEKRKLNSSKVVPLGAFVSWVFWPKGERVPVYNVKDKKKVPAEHLAWNGTEPPLATQCINAMLAVEGEAWPYLFVFKKTGFKAGELIFQLEGRRGMAQKGRGLYELGSQKKQNAAKQTYHELTARPVGDCPESLVELVKAYEVNKAQVHAKAEGMADDGADLAGEGEGEVPPF